jgi:hypothetical protein
MTANTFLQRLVDIVWGEANEDKSVPSTEWSRRMIALAVAEEGGVVIALTKAECEAINAFFSYGATRGNHGWTKEGGEGTGPTPGPLTPHVLNMGTVNVKVFETGIFRTDRR